MNAVDCAGITEFRMKGSSGVAGRAFEGDSAFSRPRRCRKNLTPEFPEMLLRRFQIAILLIVMGAVLTLATDFTAFSIRDWRCWALFAAAACSLASLYWIWPRKTEEDPEVTALRAKLAATQARMNEQTETFEKARSVLLTDLSSKTQRLDERERDLVNRFARFHEFLEYPTEDVHAEKVSGDLQRLSEKDREVRELLEAEAERVYEKIRRNGYTVEGQVDAIAIRDEALELIKRVAKIYKPESQFPLLETSFEQLARAASRVCLHALVLLERLPVNVQQYNINTLHSYIRKAVVGYGMYQKATPWLNYLSRGIYAGRLAATTNPATLGAWWLATELGKRGAQKMVEGAVDRQAVAVLRDLVTIIGVEAAGIYGTGFRQRDPAWILGTELVELIHAFPPSGESLKFGLQKVTALPLRSEYDRVYLYRCLANHRSAGLQLADSAMLTRDEREAMARQLELFFVAHIHGASESNCKRWREGFERRFDLRLKLDAVDQRGLSSKEQQVTYAMRSLITFLRHVMSLDDAAMQLVGKSFRTLAMLPEAQRQSALSESVLRRVEHSFEPPELDPGADVTKSFVSDLAACAAVPEQPDAHAEQLIRETFNYFRHTTKEAEAAIGAAWKQKLRWHCVEMEIADEVPPEAARSFFLSRQPGEKLVLAYGSLGRRLQATVHALPNHWLFGAENSDGSGRRTFVVATSAEPGAGEQGEVVWSASPPLTIERVHGMLLDDVAITNGRWSPVAVRPGVELLEGDLLISGSLRGGRYRYFFRPLLEFSGVPKALPEE